MGVIIQFSTSKLHLDSAKKVRTKGSIYLIEGAETQYENFLQIWRRGVKTCEVPPTSKDGGQNVESPTLKEGGQYGKSL